MLNKIFHWFFMPCSKATLEVEKKLKGELSFLHKFRLFMHIFICKYCDAYNKKAEIIDIKLKNITKENQLEEKESIDIEFFKKGLKEKIKKMN